MAARPLWLRPCVQLEGITMTTKRNVLLATGLLAGALLTAGLDMAQVFLCVGLANALVTLYVFVQDPDYGKRMKALLLRWTVRS